MKTLTSLFCAGVCSGFLLVSGSVWAQTYGYVATEHQQLFVPCSNYPYYNCAAGAPVQTQIIAPAVAVPVPLYHNGTNNFYGYQYHHPSYPRNLR